MSNTNNGTQWGTSLSFDEQGISGRYNGRGQLEVCIPPGVAPEPVSKNDFWANVAHYSLVAAAITIKLQTRQDQVSLRDIVAHLSDLEKMLALVEAVELETSDFTGAFEWLRSCLQHWKGDTDGEWNFRLFKILQQGLLAKLTTILDSMDQIAEVRRYSIDTDGNGAFAEVVLAEDYECTVLARQSAEAERDQYKVELERLKNQAPVAFMFRGADGRLRMDACRHKPSEPGWEGVYGESRPAPRQLCSAGLEDLQLTVSDGVHLLEEWIQVSHSHDEVQASLSVASREYIDRAPAIKSPRPRLDAVEVGSIQRALEIINWISCRSNIAPKDMSRLDRSSAELTALLAKLPQAEAKPA